MRLPLLALLVMTTAAQAEDVTVFAAASLKDALDEIAAGFSAETGHSVSISYAGSGTLARQIIEGAPADIFISAAVNWMDEVETAGMIADDSRLDLLGNDLVLISHAPGAEIALGPDTDLPGLLDGGRLAMAMVDSVPAGQYGKAALESLGLWTSVEPLVAQTDNVRATLALVARDEAPLGIVYGSDAQAEPAVHVRATFPADSHPPITYPAALLTGAEDQADRDFFALLNSEDAANIFVSHGFSLTD
ncbi:MAG: molybdate ABC transporter substrate-binding protein [Paracoccus sp. (in: a-proteobacteria)]|nr:molybdate ABC transporter substrate-binding protein [Paracoccus sp. (in: a-proteobacteria)]